MSSPTPGLFSSYEDVWVVDGVRTPFAEYNGLLGDISPTDMGIKVARALFARAGDGINLGKFELALCVGTESMTRNPVAAYTHRGGFRMGQIEFKDFLWEALLDPSVRLTIGDTAESLARQYQITRPEVDEFA